MLSVWIILSSLQWLRETPEPMGQLARWLTFIEQFDFEVVHRAGARRGNADGLSRRPDAHADAHQGAQTAVQVVTVEQTANDADAPEPDNVKRQVSGSAGEHPDATELTLAEQQMRDPEISSLVKMRLQQTHPPAMEEMHAESTAANKLHS